MRIECRREGQEYINDNPNDKEIKNLIHRSNTRELKKEVKLYNITN